MMTTSMLKPLIAWLWLSGFAAGAATAENKPADAPEADVEFEGKVVTLRFKSEAGSGCVLEEAYVRRIGGRKFIVGKLADVSNNSGNVGRTLWVSVDEVSQLCEFKSVEELKALHKKHAEPDAPPAAPPAQKLAFGSKVPPALVPAVPSPDAAAPPKLAVAPDLPPPLPPPALRDVYEMQVSHFTVPVLTGPGGWAKLDRVAIYVSSDMGKTWTHFRDVRAGDAHPTYHSAADGEFWFAVRLVEKDGSADPTSLADLKAEMKVRVVTKPVVPLQRVVPPATDTATARAIPRAE